MTKMELIARHVSRLQMLHALRTRWQSKMGAKRKRSTSCIPESKSSSWEGSYWLVKSEPESRYVDGQDVSYPLSRMIQDQTTPWTGIRNYQARNFVQKMRIGDRAFFYHSNCKHPGIVGICSVVSEPFPDPTQFDPQDKYFDAKSSLENPRWFSVTMQFERKLEREIGLSELKSLASSPELCSLYLLKTSRLSVQPISQIEWDFILSLESQSPERNISQE